MSTSRRPSSRRSPGVAELTVFRITDPAILDNPDIQAFVYRALQANRLPPATIAELAARVGTDPFLGVFIGLEEGKLGMCVAQLPNSHFMLAPWVLLAYNEGSPALRDTIAETVKAWIEPTGWRKIIGCNRSGHPDAVWLRAFNKAATPSQVGMAYEFQWE